MIDDLTTRLLLLHGFWVRFDFFRQFDLELEQINFDRINFGQWSLGSLISLEHESPARALCLLTQIRVNREMTLM
jgi:hypothetical protein